MEVSRGVTLSYIGTAILGFVLFKKALDWAWQDIDMLQQHVWFGIVELTALLAIGLTAGLIVFMKKHPEIDPFIHETVVELRKVTWPGFQDTKVSTVQVVIFTVLLSFFLWGADQVWQPVTDWILTRGL